MVWVEGTVLIAIGTTEILLAKIMLSVLFTVVPVVAVLSIFKPFQPVFDTWVGFIVGFFFVQVLVTAVLVIALSLDYAFSTSTMVTHAVASQRGMGVGWPAFELCRGLSG